MTRPFFQISISLLIAGNVSGVLVVGDGLDVNDPDLAGWWDASDPTTQASLPGGFWPDRSLYGRDASAFGALPTGPTTGVGFSTVAFENGSAYFDFHQFPITLLGGPGTSASVFIVTANLLFDSAPGVAMTNLSPGEFPTQILNVMTSSFSAGIRGLPGNTRYEAIDLITSPVSIAYPGLDSLNSGRLSDFRVNGVDQTYLGGPTGGLTTGGPYRVSTIGAPGANNWDGEIAEIIIYQRKLTGEEEAEVNSYLANEYSITLVPEPSSPLMVILGLMGTCLRRKRKQL